MTEENDVQQTGDFTPDEVLTLLGAVLNKIGTVELVENDFNFHPNRQGVYIGQSENGITLSLGEPSE